ncbi:MAG: hypothetical protein FWC95_02810 [Defluviitaleaceae bacterium]|nr:hypothetical protein [Defluviitaleaceae bacterium]
MKNSLILGMPKMGQTALIVKLCAVALFFVLIYMLVLAEVFGSESEESVACTYSYIKPVVVFTGEAGYVLRWPEGSVEREWEEFVIWVAGNFLGVADTAVIPNFLGHPSLRTQSTRVITAYLNISFIRGTSPQYPQNLVYIQQLYFTDTELRDAFIYETEALISDLPDLCDYEIMFRLATIVAMVGDAHTWFRIPTRELLDFEFTFFPDGVFVMAAPAEYEHLLRAEFIYVNGFAVDEIIELLAIVVAAENNNPGLVRTQMRRSQFTNVEALRFVGVVDDPENIILMMQTEDGEVYIVETAAITQTENEERADDRMRFTFDSDALIAFRYADVQCIGANYFLYLPEYDILFYRYRRSGDTLLQAERNAMRDDVMIALRELDGVDTFVFDLRGNSGGNLLTFMFLFNDMEAERELFGDIFVVIDGSTASAGVATAALKRSILCNVTLIGEPAGQPPNLFATPPSLVRGRGGGGYIENRLFPGLTIQVSTDMQKFWANYPYSTLMPDIYIPILFRDLANGYDMVLEAIKAGILYD